MTKTLLKKQLMEVFSWLYRDKKSGKNRSKRGLVTYILLYLFIFGFLGVFFYNTASMLCGPLVGAGLGWLYFALMGLISVALGVFGGVFNTYSSLYKAKDNDLLLSMPIPSRKILAARLFGVFTMGFLYELIVMIPTLIVYFLYAPMSPLRVIFSLLIPLILAFFVLTLSCILGWVVALVSGRLKNKNIITVILSLAFIAAYYYFYMKAYSMLQGLLANPEAVGDSIQSILLPFYHMGLAAEGNILSMLIFSDIMLAMFGVMYLVLSRSFLHLATTSRGAAKAKYREKAVWAGSIPGALLRKELRHFLGSPIYMLNCGLGIFLMPVAAVVLLIKADTVSDMLTQVFAGHSDWAALLAIAAVCMITTMNDLTAPSVSLEGKSIWLVQSLPVSTWQVLLAKLKLHLLLTLVPAAFLVACVEIVLRPTAAYGVLIPVIAVLFVLLMGTVGLCLNLKMPNINWTDETVPVKQSLGVMLALFGGWAVVLAFALLYVLVRNLVHPLVYLALVAVLLAVLSAVLLAWLKNRGTRIFEAL